MKNDFVLITTVPLSFQAPWNGIEYNTRPTGQDLRILGAAKTALWIPTYIVHMSLTEGEIDLLEMGLKMKFKGCQETDNFIIKDELRAPYVSLVAKEVVKGKNHVNIMQLYTLNDYLNVVEPAVPVQTEEMKLEEK
jgi:hypothetical protein